MPWGTTTCNSYSRDLVPTLHFPLTVMYLATFRPQRQKLSTLRPQKEVENDERLALFLLDWNASLIADTFL